jgi:hypothetical protein
MFGLMTNIVQFAYWNCQKKRKHFRTHWGKYQPVYILLLATVLVCAQPCCMLYIGSWKCDGQFSTDQIKLTDMASLTKAGWQYDAQGFFVKNGTKASDLKEDWFLHAKDDWWAPGCKVGQGNFFFDGGKTNALVPNTTVGWMIQIFGTYFGFLLMFVGVCKATLLHTKIANKWRALRRRSAVTATNV